MYTRLKENIMGLLAFVLGGFAAVVVSIAFPNTWQKGVTWVRGFWDKVQDVEKDTPEVK
jgi:hypothetical protein